MTTYAAPRTVRFDATAIAAVVALLLSALALVVALSDRHATTAAVSTGSRATTTVATTSAVAATAGNLTRQQAIAHAMRVDSAGSKFASSNITSTRMATTSTTVNPYWSKIKIMDAHRAS